LLKPVEKTDLNQISLTGMRSILLVGLLMQSPRSLEEIKKIFIDMKIMEPAASDDVLRIDLNTLRVMGCEISRASNNTDYKYKLIKHPFSLEISDEEIAVIKRAYKGIKNSSNIELILEYDKLLKKIAEHMCDEEKKQALYGISVLKSYNVKLIKDLLEDCKLHRVLVISYKTPAAKKESRKELVIQDLVFQNDKIYLFAYDLRLRKSVILNIKRILSIISRTSGGDKVKIEYLTVKFRLKSFGLSTIEENEKILEETDEGYLIEGKYYNDFFAAQRILSFGSACTVLEPVNFREQIIQKLKNMRDVYND